jgi:hypothetical protein
LENDFFGSLEDSGDNKMNRAGFIALGKKSNATLLVAGNILSSTFGKRKIFLILAISCLLKPSFDGLILLTNFLTFLIYVEIICYAYCFYIFIKCFSEKSVTKAIKISTVEIIIFICAFSMDMQIPLFLKLQNNYL